MQNASFGQLKLLATRVGEGSHLCILGDGSQPDRRVGDNWAGGGPSGREDAGKGRKARMQYYKETFIFAAATRAWYKVDTAAASPRARSGHHAALVHGAGESRTMYMFGGEYGNAKGTSFTHLKCACPHLAVAGPTTTSR